MVSRFRLLIIVWLFLAILVGCSAPAPPTVPANVSPAPPVATVPVSPTPPATPPSREPTLPNTILVRYTSIGELLDDELTIYNDGRSELKRYPYPGGLLPNLNEFTLQPIQITRLKELFEKADFFNLNAEYHPKGVQFDASYYSVTYRLGEKQHTVVFESSAGPEALYPVLGELNEIITNNTK